MFNGGGGLSPISPNGGMPVANGNYSSSYTPKMIENGENIYASSDDVIEKVNGVEINSTQTQVPGNVDYER